MTTNNHPAHGPVSLDRLHQIREILSKAAAQSDGGNLGHAMADAVKVIDGVIAAFGAEPVLYAAEETLAYAKMGELHLKCLSQPMGDAIIPLYLHAQPVSVVPDERASFNVWNNDENLPIAGVSAKNAAWLAWQARAALCGNSVLDVPPERPADSSSGDDVEAWFDEGWNACRAAMLQVGNHTEQHLDMVDHSGDANKMVAGNSPVTPDCSCRTCRPVTFTDSRFVVCPECGNKRCPHANDHRNACTGSNEPRQAGSAYPAAPQQEVKS
ncbi:TPA: hypothetical protein ACT2RL_000660 [Citrobacter braakii]